MAPDVAGVAGGEKKTSRLFGSAVAHVRSHVLKESSNNRPSEQQLTGALISSAEGVDSPFEQHAIHYIDHGERSAGRSSSSKVDQETGKRRSLRNRSSPYEPIAQLASNVLRRTLLDQGSMVRRGGAADYKDPLDGKWKHDCFEGTAATHPGGTIFVRNLPQGASYKQLHNLFSEVGDVVSLKIEHGPLPTARIGFLKCYSAQEAVEKFHGFVLSGSKLKVAETGERTTSLSESSLLRSSLGKRKFLPNSVPRQSIFDRITV